MKESVSNQNKLDLSNETRVPQIEQAKYNSFKTNLNLKLSKGVKK